MFQKAKIILLVLSLLVLPFIAAQKSSAEMNEDFALKISLESHIEKKLKQVIAEITGTDRVVIFVNAELGSVKGGDGGRGKLIEKKKEDALVLPGVPAKKEFGAGQSETSELLLPGAAGTKFTVKRLMLSIWIDKSVPESIVELIRDLAKNVIGFSQDRGDQINVKKVDFEAKKFYWSSLFLPPGLFWLILSLVGGFLMITIAMFLLDPFKKVIPAIKNIDWNIIRGAGSTSTVERSTYEKEIITGRTDVLEKETGEKEANLPFAFIRERDLSSLAFLLKDKTTQEAAIVINYLEPGLGMRLLEYFPKEKQVEIALTLGHEEINMERVNSLEELIKGKLSYVVGGENKLISILDMTSDDVRDKVIKTIETKDAQTGTRLKHRVKSLETIIRGLTAQGIQIIYRNVDPTLFAQVLKSYSEDIQKKVLSSLSAGAAERLQQEMDLSRPLPSIRLRKEKQNLMIIVRRLINEGLLEVESN